MSLAIQDLLTLLPAILRSRDLAQAQLTPGILSADDQASLIELQTLVANGDLLTPTQKNTLAQLQQRAQAGPLMSLVGVIAEQIAALQENVEQLYDDQFIETCADWVVPYIGDLIGYQVLHGVTPAIASPRAEVAHTIAYRRRKGTAVALEQIARDVTGWNATAVEYFQRLIVTQYMNHLRPQCLATPDLRQWQPLERLGGAFDTIMRTPEMRRIETGGGRYNIPNIGMFVWSIDAYALSASPAVAVDARRFYFHPLGIDQPLYTRPAVRADFAGLSTPLDVPEPISRRVLDAARADYYTAPEGVPLSLCVYESNAGVVTPVNVANVCICNLQDDAGNWAHLPTTNGMYAVDPVLGRLAARPDLPANTTLLVDFLYGFSAPLGGGEYDRTADVTDAEPPPALLNVPADFASMQDAIDNLGANGGVVVITNSGRYEETLTINAPADKSIVLRADNGCRPTLVLTGASSLGGGAGAQIGLHGLLITGATLAVNASAGNALAQLDIAHCTLVPGLSLAPDCTPQHPGDASLVVGIASVAVTLASSIVGPLRIDVNSTLSATDSIIDATATTAIAYAGEDGTGPGGPLQLQQCTVVGKIHAQTLPLVSNAILLADLASGDSWQAAIVADRLQEGCVRFSYLPPSVRVPRRYQCLPESASTPAAGTPSFTTLRYGFPAYAQLATSSGAALLTGADNECQPGAFNSVYGAQRETNLLVRLAEYLRVGLEAGVIYAS